MGTWLLWEKMVAVCWTIGGCRLLVAGVSVMVALSLLAACITSGRGRLGGPSCGRTSRVCVCVCAHCGVVVVRGSFACCVVTWVRVHDWLLFPSRLRLLLFRCWLHEH